MLLSGAGSGDDARLATTYRVEIAVALDAPHFRNAVASSRLTGSIGSRNNPSDT
jgi:hypothetical protein